ncbi:hypothetical protein RJ640_017376 [Escallonia rubra]|uniref:Uncharacterized protein n=1 Tax=Escallonia rubra TaxID=112253 RepID=A0AA88U974_9ASTE|nr:hypothetical protein RJ640_017376 [Escallonia rubra]
MASITTKSDLESPLASLLLSSQVSPVNQVIYIRPHRGKVSLIFSSNPTKFNSPLKKLQFMDPEGILNLFDACWFNLEIFKQQSVSSNSAIDEADPDQGVEENATSGPKFSSLPSILMRSKSDQLSALTSFSSDTLSPNSVLLTPHLQTILSGKEVAVQEESRKPKRFGSMKGRLVKKRGVTKSLSDLEFEELKGFMDLGFVFSEEDKESSLVEIIPGLQRLGEEKDHRNHHQQQQEGSITVKESLVPRPYLSEAWEVLGRREKVNPLMNWRVPALSDEMDMKDSLKWWAHTVASTVR